MYVIFLGFCLSFLADRPTPVRLPSKNFGLHFGKTTSTLVPKCRVI